MKNSIRIFLFTGVLSVAVACTNGEKSPFDKKPANQTAPASGAVENKKVYSGGELYTQKCTACHGGDGNLGLSGAKKISESVLTQQEREELIANGKKTMPAFKSQLSEEEIKAIAEYTFTLK